MLDADGGICLNAECSVFVRDQQRALAHPPGRKNSDESQRNGIQLLVKMVSAIDDTSRFEENLCLTLTKSRLLDAAPRRCGQLARDQSRREKDKQGNPFLPA